MHTNRLRIHLLCVAAVTCLLMAVVDRSHAQQKPQQLTAETLIGNAVSGDPNRYQNLVEAIKRFNNRDYLAARTLLERAVQDDPKLPPADLMLAKMYSLTNQNTAARAALERTVRDNPGDPETYILLADQLFSQGRLIEAEALYDKAIANIDSFKGNEKRKRYFVIRSRAGRAAVAAVRRDWDGSIDDLKIWVEADPESANAHHRLGRALFLTKQTEPGFRELSKAHELQDTLPNPYVTAAMLYAEMGDDDTAGKTFVKAVEADRNDIRTLIAYAQWLIQSGNIERAEKVLAQARKTEPESLEVLTLSGVAAKMLGKRQPAHDYYMEALSVAPANRGVINQMALLLVDQAQVDPAKGKRALDFARMNAQLFADDAEANITLAWVFYQLGQNIQANQALQKGLRLGNLNADSRYLVSKMLVDQGRKDDAQKLLKEALASTTGIFVNRKEAQALVDSLN